jgi:ferritin-like metal-binding protein YciE
MDKKQKKIKYQELFHSGQRNSYFGEKKIEEALREMETRSNLEKLTKALKSIWKQTDEQVTNLESVFPKVELQELLPDPEQKTEVIVKLNTDAQSTKTETTKMEKRRVDISNLKDLEVVSYDHLIELVDDLNIEQVTEILTSVAGEEKNDHQYLTKLAEKLLKNRDSKKIPDSKP